MILKNIFFLFPNGIAGRWWGKDKLCSFVVHASRVSSQMASAHTKNSDKPWDLDKPTIFNHVDSFVQRCDDMIDVCDAMIVFGRLVEVSCEC